MSVGHDMAEVVGSLALFADLRRPQVMAAALAFEEMWFSEGQRVLREGFSQPDFFIIVEGEAVVRVQGRDTARLGRGDFFGEISVLSGEPPSADVVAMTALRCLCLPGDRVRPFLTDFPDVAYRMLQVEASRLRDAIRWRS